MILVVAMFRNVSLQNKTHVLWSHTWFHRWWVTFSLQVSSCCRNRWVLVWSRWGSDIDFWLVQDIFIFFTCTLLYRSLFLGCLIGVEVIALIIFYLSVWLLLWICLGISILLSTALALGILTRSLKVGLNSD